MIRKKKLMALWLVISMILTLIPASALEDEEILPDTNISQFELDADKDADGTNQSMSGVAEETLPGQYEEKSDGEVSQSHGICGENLTWNLENGTLTVTGTGKMFDYTWLVDDDGVEYTDAPWYPLREEITQIVIAETVSSIGANAFADCYHVDSLSIPEQITDIGEGAFEGCGASDSALLYDISTDETPGNDTSAPETAPTNETIRYSVLALDVSGSMDAVPMTAQKAAALRYCEAMLNAIGDNRVALITFGTSISKKCDFTSDIEALRDAVNSISAGGGTNINGAFKKADELLQSAPENAKKSIILCSDGLPNNGGSSSSGMFKSSDHSSYAYANAVLETSNRIKERYDIYTLGFFHSLTGKNRTFAEKFMEAIQNEGYFSITDPDELEFAFDGVANAQTGTNITLTFVPGFDVECNCKHPGLCNSDTCENCNCYNVHCYQQEFTYNDAYFTHDTSRRYLPLEQLSLGLAYAAYSYQCINESEEHKDHKYRDFDWSVHDALTQMRFDYFKSYGYQEYAKSEKPNHITGEKDPVLGEEDTIGCAFAVRTPEDGGTPIIAVAVRGGGYDNEWSGNFEIGKTVTIGGFVFHKNFLQSAMSVLYRLNYYIQDLKDSGKVADLDKARVWVVGYSRGAAVANVAAHLLTESSIHTDKVVTVTSSTKISKTSFISDSFDFPNLGFPESQIYAYTFATPAAATAIASNYVNPGGIDSYIHNRIGYSDVVPMLVMAKWKYKPFGDTRYLPFSIDTKRDNMQFNIAYDKMRKMYQDIFSRSGRTNEIVSDYSANDNKQNLLKTLLDLGADALDNADNYYTNYQDTIINLIHRSPLSTIEEGEAEEKLNFLSVLLHLDENLLAHVLGKIVSACSNYITAGNVLEEPYSSALKHIKVHAVLHDLNYDAFHAINEDYVTERLTGVSMADDTMWIILEPILINFIKDNCGDSGTYPVSEITSTFWGPKGEIVDKPIDYQLCAELLYEAFLQVLNVDSLGGLIICNQVNGKAQVDIKNAIFQEHYPELYLSWLMNMPSYAVDAEDIGGKVMRIKCPTDVYVYDENGVCIASVVNDVVTEEQIPVTVNDRSEKTLYLPADDDISVKIKATGDGTMDVTVTEYKDSNTVSCRTLYLGVSLANGQQFGVGVEGGQNGAVTLTSGSVTVMPSLTVNGDGMDGTLVTLDLNDDSMKTVSALTNEFGTLGTLPSPTRSGYSFGGWYTDASGGDKVTADTVFSQEATIYARWAYSSNNNNADSGNTPSSGSSGGSSSGGGNSKTSYLISISKIKNGSISFVKGSKVAYRKDTITINPVPDDGYDLESISVTNRKGESIELTRNDDGSYSFVMPAENVTVNAVFALQEQAVQYHVSTSFSPNGSITVSPTNAAAGTTIAVSVLANSGYSLNRLTYMDDTGKTFVIHGYSFVMPEHNVTVSAVFSHAPFSDVTDGPFYDAVMWAYQKGITTGTSETTFSPKLACTRAQTVTFLWRSAGSPSPSSFHNPFSDVSESAYYYNAVLWAMEKGITKGTTSTTFSPGDTVRRGQVVTFLYRWNDYIERTSSYAFRAISNPFSDVWDGPGIYFYEPVLWAVGMGITNGITSTTFAPNEICTRGQIVTFIYRFCVSKEMN